MEQFTQKQQAIINTAIQLIAENGIQNLTIKNLAARIGVVEGAIYRHFSSKLEILLGILSLFRTMVKSPLTNLNASQSRNALDKLELLFQQRFEHFSKNPAFASVIFSEEIFQNEKRLSEEVYSIMQNSQETIRNLLVSGQADGSVRPDISADQLAVIITGALRLTVTQWRLSGYSFDLAENGRNLWQAFRQILIK
jgi:TetR/AcrR family fatty acid metabolism transcriptional regulator